MNLTNSKKQLWKALDWLISLIIWLIGITLAAPFIGFIASIIVKMYRWGFTL